MGRKASDKERTKNDKAKEKLIVKCMVYFQNYGTNATMNKLAKDLSISKTTVYNHFKTKDDLVHAATKYKLSIIEDYKTVLANSSLPYLERYRKSMLFFCVQAFDVSALFLKNVEEDFPETWSIIKRFKSGVFKDLKDYYTIGIEKEIFTNCSPEFLAINDQLFFNSLATPELLIRYDIPVLEAFKLHFYQKFNGVLAEGKESSF